MKPYALSAFVLIGSATATTFHVKFVGAQLVMCSSTGSDAAHREMVKHSERWAVGACADSWEDKTSLQAVHDHAENGDTIVLGPGTYSTGGSTRNLLEITKGITIKAAEAKTVVLDGSDQKRVVHINVKAMEKVLLEGLDITRGKSGYGGGGVYIVSGTVLFDTCNIYKNKISHESGRGGGVLLEMIDGGTVPPTVTFTNCNIYENESPQAGGGVMISAGTVTFTSCNIYENEVPHYGGGVHIHGGTVAFDNCNIYKNLKTTAGGDYNGEVWVDDSNGSPSAAFSSCTTIDGEPANPSMVGNPVGKIMGLDTAIEFTHFNGVVYWQNKWTCFKDVYQLGVGTRWAASGTVCEIDCDSSTRRLAEASEEADAPGPHTGPAGRELVKALLKDHPELDGLRGEDGTVATNVLDKLIQFTDQLFGQPALA